MRATVSDMGPLLLARMLALNETQQGVLQLVFKIADDNGLLLLDDGLLQVREIIRLRLNAELTTLSACDTGVGKLQGQEGISNLVEAFLVAGSQSVVASLWSADDTFASALMERFYQRMAQGEDTSSALRERET